MIIPDNVTVYMNGRAYYAHVCGFYQNNERLSLSIGASCLKDGGAEVNCRDTHTDERRMSAEKRAYGAYSVKVSEYPLYHLSGVVMSDDIESGFVSFFDRDGDEILRVRRNRLVSILRVDKGEALLGYLPYDAAVNADGDNGKWEGE